MSVSYSNSLSLTAQRGLNQAVSAANAVAQRLSSGMRINKPSDDSAGLSISSMLGVHSRVFSQGMLNLNNGISAIGTAEAALGQQQTILERLKELAVQAANGVFSLTQRIALNQEARSLTDEFNRLMAGTAFNGMNLLDGSRSATSLQAGYSSLEFQTGSQLKRTVGTGAFSHYSSDAINWMGTVYGIEAADVNNDGISDLIAVGDNDTGKAIVWVAIGNGLGGFGVPTKYLLGGAADSLGASLALADLNGDGYLDIVAGGSNDARQAEFNVLFNDGLDSEGSFSTRQSYAVFGGRIESLRLADMNGDGQLDIVAALYESAELYTTASIFYNQGGGTFSTSSSTNLDIGIGSGWLHSLAVGDFNNDGRPDIVAVGDVPSGQAWLYSRMNLGGGSFSAVASKQLGTHANSSAWSVNVGDLDGDGYLDVVVGGENDAGAGQVSVLRGLGAGSFAAPVSYIIDNGGNSIVYSAKLFDINGDGIPDILTAGLNGGGIGHVNVFLGAGDGTFGESMSFLQLGSSTARDITAADVNLNGALDLAFVTNAGMHCYHASTTEVTTLQRVNLTTAQDALAALSTIEHGLERVRKELGALGAMQSRLKHALNQLSAVREGYQAAYSSITDADMAQEAATYVRQKILSQMGTALMAQANQSSRLLLELLNSSATAAPRV